MTKNGGYKYGCGLINDSFRKFGFEYVGNVRDYKEIVENYFRQGYVVIINLWTQYDGLFGKWCLMTGISGSTYFVNDPSHSYITSFDYKNMAGAMAIIYKPPSSCASVLQ